MEFVGINAITGHTGALSTTFSCWPNTQAKACTLYTWIAHGLFSDTPALADLIRICDTV